jgi:hypothetical protein
MFGRLFGDRRDIDRVIFDIAEHHRPRDHQRLFTLLRGREMFVSIASSNVPIEDGRRFQVSPGDEIQMKTGSLPNGMSCVIFYLDRTDPRLGRQYAAMTVPDAFEMVSKTEVDALLIQNAQASWVAFPRAELGTLRARYF